MHKLDEPIHELTFTSAEVGKLLSIPANIEERTSGQQVREGPVSFAPEYETHTISVGIEHYDKPLKLAIGVPSTIDPEASPELPETDPHLLAFEYELAAYQQMLPDLMITHQGMFVAILNGKLIDQDRKEFGLLKRMYVQYPDKFVLVRQVGQEDTYEDYFDSPEGEAR